MDDLFQILIYLVIIISFLASIFKKKKPVETSEREPQETGYVDRDVYQEKEKYSSNKQEKSEVEEYNSILNEIENLFKEEKPVLNPDEIKTSNTESLKTKTRIEEQTKTKLEDQSVRDKITSKHTFEDTWQRKRKSIAEKTKSINSKMTEEAKQFEQYLQKRDNEQTISSDIRRRINNPETLREYIVFTEILNKPKALRRR